MTNYQSEELENIRRTCDRGLRMVLNDHTKIDDEDGNYSLVMMNKKTVSRLVDLFNHIKDQVERIKDG